MTLLCLHTCSQYPFNSRSQSGKTVLGDHETMMMRVITWLRSLLQALAPVLFSGFIQKSDCGFPGKNYDFFQTFQGILFIFMWTKTLQNWLLNAEILYIMYSSILYTKCDSNFFYFELQMLYVMNCKNINKCMGNQQCNRHLHFPGQHYSFQGFFQTFPYLWSF